MSTDPRFHENTSDLAIRVHQQTRAVIDAELQRLARRVPSLAAADLAVIDAALDDLAESLIIGRLRGAQHDVVPLLARLFDVTRAASDSGPCRHERSETTPSAASRWGRSASA